MVGMVRDKIDSDSATVLAAMLAATRPFETRVRGITIHPSLPFVLNPSSKMTIWNTYLNPDSCSSLFLQLKEERSIAVGTDEVTVNVNRLVEAGTLTRLLEDDVRSLLG